MTKLIKTFDVFLGEPIKHNHTDVINIYDNQTIDGNKTFNNNVDVNGIFTAASSVFIHTEIIDLSANYLTLNSNITGSPSENAGINVNRGTEPVSTLTWNEDTDKWIAGISGSTENIILQSQYNSVTADIDYLSGQIDTKLDTSIYQNASGAWESTYGTVLANSGEWESVYASVVNTSSNWDSVHSTVLNTSGDWESVHTSVVNTSSNWDSTHSTVLANSGEWESVYSSTVNTSANWNSVYSTVLANSASWEESPDINYVSGIVSGHTTQIATLSSNIIELSGDYSFIDIAEVAYDPSNYTESTADISGHLYGVDTELGSQLALITSISGDLGTGDDISITYSGTNYTQVTNDVSGHFSGINTAIGTKLATSIYQGASGVWQSNYSTTLANSGRWESAYTQVNATSANWSSAYSTVLANSASWEESTDITYISGQVSANTTNIASLSGDWSYGDTLELVYNPTNYTEADATLSGHLYGIDNKTWTYGLSGSRPSVTSLSGYMYFDSSLGYPIWWSGTAWVNSTGAEV